MVNRGANNEVEVKETTQSTNANGFNVVHRKPKKGATGGSGADGADVQITNVPAEYGDADLLKRHHLFGRYGRVVKINVAQGSAKGKVNLTVTYSTSSEAGLAAHCVDGAYLSGQALSAKSSSPSPTTERAVRPSSHDVKYLPQLPKSLQPQPVATSSTTDTAITAAKPSEARKETQPKAAEAAKSNQQTTTQTQKPVTAALAPGVSAWSKPLTASVKGATSYSSMAGSTTTTTSGASTTSTTTPAATQNAEKTATKTATPAATSDKSPVQTTAAKPQATKQQQAHTITPATTAAAIVRGNTRASPKTQVVNGVAGGNVSLPAALRGLGHPEVAFGGDEADEAPKMSNVLDQPATSGPFTGKFGAPDANDNKLFDDQAHVNSVLSDSGAIDNTPPRSEVSHPAYDTISAPRTAPQSYASATNGLVAGQNAGQRNQQRGRPGSSHRPGGRRGAPAGGAPGLAGQPMVNVPPVVPPVGGPAPPNFNMGRTKLNPEAPEFYPAAARQPVLPGGMPLNPGQYGGMYDQYPSFPPGGPGQPVPWGYPPARGAPFGAGPRGYYGGPYGYQ